MEWEGRWRGGGDQASFRTTSHLGLGDQGQGRCLPRARLGSWSQDHATCEWGPSWDWGELLPTN